MNWGKASAAGGANAPASTFPLSYNNSCRTIIHGQTMGNGSGMRSFGIASFTNTTITWNNMYTTSDGRTCVIRYLAIGN